MLDGKRCPECGQDVGFWAVALGVFRIRCPRCGIALRHVTSRGMNVATSVVAMVSVVGSLAAGALVGWSLRESGVLMALGGGIATCAGLVLGLGFATQVALTSLVCRTQPLARDDKSGRTIGEEAW